MNSVQSISDSYLCSNCGACYVVCPKDSIEFKRTSIGRIYANVKDTCIGCGLCTKVCPSIDSLQINNKFSDIYTGNIIKAYIGRSNDRRIYENAQSGGGVTAVIKYLFVNKLIDAAVLCQMFTGNPPKVEGVIVTCVEDLELCQKSCYTPVPLLTALKKIKNRKAVAVVGLPCHIEGLALIQAQFASYKNIKFRFGLICDRTLSDTIQKVILSYSSNEPCRIFWRDKNNGMGKMNYKDAQVVVEKTNGEKLLLPKYYRTKLKDFFTAPRCRVCFDKMNIHSDIVFGDPWGIKGVDWKNGDSLIISRTSSGEQLLRDMAADNNILIKEVLVSEVFEGQHIFQRKKSVTASSIVLKSLVKPVDSFLLDNVNYTFVTNKEIEDTNKLIRAYIGREETNENSIIKDARELLNNVPPPKKQSFLLKIKKKILRKHVNKGFTFFLTGVETNNKGAELMLYAILQEIERRFPNAKVFISDDRIRQGISYIRTNVDFRILPFSKLEKIFRLNGLFKLLHIPFRFMPHNLFLGHLDYYLDGSGFIFSDQFVFPPKYAKLLKMQLSVYKKKGAKIVFLPQAFGPFEKSSSIELLSVLNQYSSIIIPREKVSYNYLTKTNLVEMDKVKLFTDFTSLVDGIFPIKYEHLRNGICIIPNMQMINKKKISYDDYVSFLLSLVSELKKTNKPIYFLNHEGIKDERLAYQCQQILGDTIEVVTGLNALEVKGMIASAYLVITSRFHGLASALNSCIPCLATSWSHKYKELYNDYEMNDCILPLNNIDKAIEMVLDFMKESKNKDVRNHLMTQVPKIKSLTRDMWNYIWSV